MVPMVYSVTATEFEFGIKRKLLTGLIPAFELSIDLHMMETDGFTCMRG